MYKKWKRVLCVLLGSVMLFSTSITTLAASSGEKQTDGMFVFLSKTEDGLAVFDSEAAAEAGYDTDVIAAVEKNVALMNIMVTEYGGRIDETFTVTIYSEPQVSTRVQRKGVSKVVTTWNRVDIYMDSVDTAAYIGILQKIVDVNGTICDSLNSYADYKGGDEYVSAAAMIGAVVALWAWSYLFPAQVAASSGKGIIMRTDIDYINRTEVLSYLSQ